MRLLYDVAHNIVKIEEHIVEGKNYSSLFIARAQQGHSRQITLRCQRHTER